MIEPVIFPVTVVDPVTTNAKSELFKPTPIVILLLVAISLPILTPALLIVELVRILSSVPTPSGSIVILFWLPSTLNISIGSSLFWTVNSPVFISIIADPVYGNGSLFKAWDAVTAYDELKAYELEIAFCTNDAVWAVVTNGAVWAVST